MDRFDSGNNYVFAIIAIPIITLSDGGFEGTAIEFKGLEAAKNEVFFMASEKRRRND